METHPQRSQDLPLVFVESREQWRKWLVTHHATNASIWLVTYKKKAAGDCFLTYDDIVEEALCFGWVDSLPRSLDAERSMRRLSPRKKGSGWSAVNKARVEKLSRAHKMAEPGLAIVEQAKADGSWDRLNEIETLSIPTDLRAALEADPKANANFSAFPRSSKRLILEWIDSAKTAETRARRVSETVCSAAKNIRANHYRQQKTAGAQSRRK